MTVGIVSYLSQRGLGTSCHDLRKQLGIDRQMVIPDGNWPYYQPWMNGEELYLQQWEVQRDDLVAWQQCDKIDTLVSIETGFGDHTFKWAKELGMRTVLVVMWESFNPNLPAYQNVDLYICPSIKAFQEVPFDNKLYLPWPVDTDEIGFEQRTGPAKVFVHNAGSGGANGRKGTMETILGFIRADVDAKLIVRAQQVELIEQIRQFLKSDVATDDPRVTLDGSHVAERAQLYEEGDVLICVHQYDGHNLVALEGLSAGMPVITTDAAPMNEFFTPGYPLCVKVAERKFAGTVNPHALAYRVDIDDLAEKIRWCTTRDMADLSRTNREIAEGHHSWNFLRDRWKKAIGIA